MARKEGGEGGEGGVKEHLARCSMASKARVLLDNTSFHILPWVVERIPLPARLAFSLLFLALLVVSLWLILQQVRLLGPN